MPIMYSWVKTYKYRPGSTSQLVKLASSCKQAFSGNALAAIDKYSTPGPVNTWMGDCFGAGISSRYVTRNQFNSALRPCGLGKSSTRLRTGVKAGHVHLCRVAGNTV